MTLYKLLREINVCSQGLTWVGRRSLKTAWATCHNGDWMQYFLWKFLPFKAVWKEIIGDPRWEDASSGVRADIVREHAPYRLVSSILKIK